MLLDPQASGVVQEHGLVVGRVQQLLVAGLSEGVRVRIAPARK